MQKPRVNSTFIFNEVKDYLMITIAMMSYCIGWTVFLLPNNITTGGVPGISSLLFWGLGIPVQASYFAINAVLLVVALRVLGLQFCLKTIYAVLVLTVSLTVFQSHYQGHLLSDQPFMAAIIGSVFCESRTRRSENGAITATAKTAKIGAESISDTGCAS